MIAQTDNSVPLDIELTVVELLSQFHLHSQKTNRLWPEKRHLNFLSINYLSSADNICKQFGRRSGPTKRRV